MSHLELLCVLYRQSKFSIAIDQQSYRCSLLLIDDHCAFGVLPIFSRCISCPRQILVRIVRRGITFSLISIQSLGVPAAD